MLAGLLPVLDATSAPAQTVGSAIASDACTAAPATKATNGFAFPAWSDGAGWTNPDQYETIASGSVDLAGPAGVARTPVLIGRNASGFETYTWDDGYAPGGISGKAYNPTPGQWRQVFPSAGAEVQPFATADGWWDPAVYSTVQMADVDPRNAGDELVVRLSDGLAVYRWNTATSTWGRPTRTSVFSDADGWGQNGSATTLAGAGGAEYYSTITTGNLDGVGAREVIARGKDGIEVWSFDGSTLNRVPTGGEAILTDAEGWAAPQYYSTIRLADVDGNGRDELLARSSAGMTLYRYEPATRSWRQRETMTSWSDDAGWKSDSYFRTISVADVNGDGRADLVGRSSGGLDARTFVDGPDDGSWAPLAPPSGFSDAQGWTAAGNYLTVQPADVDPAPGTEMIGRADGGVISYALRNGAWTQVGGTMTDFSDTNGFGSQDPPGGGLPAGFRYDTIMPVRFDPKQPELVIGRGATGLITRRADGSSPSAPFPAYTDLSALVAAPDGTIDLGSTDDAQKRAFHHINTAALRTYFGAQSGSLIDQFRFPANSPVWPGLVGSLTSAQTTKVDNGASVFDPGDEALQAMNVPRATYNQVLQDTADWTSSVNEVSAHLLGTEGIKQFLTEGFLDQSNLVSSISANFDGNEALYAFFADLMWGLIGALGVVIIGLAPETAAVLAAVASVAGAGVAGAMGFFNPNGFADSKAAELEAKRVDTLCTANRFVDESYDQIVQDYGLLKTAGATFNESKLTAADYAKAVTAANRSQALWVWQQFGDAKPAVGVSNMWVGFCRPTDTTCKLDQSGTAETIWTDPASGVRYRLIGELPGSEGTDGNCEFDVLANTPDLKGLNPDKREWASPRHTAGPLIGEPFVDENTGIQGWNLGNKWCGTL
jgi:hypothetical protein